MYRSRRVRMYKKRTSKRVKRTTQRSGGPSFSRPVLRPFSRPNRVFPVEPLPQRSRPVQVGLDRETGIPHRPQGSPRGVYVRHTRRPPLPRPQRKLPPTPPELKSMLQVIDDNDYGVFISDAVRSKVAESKTLTPEEISVLMDTHDMAKRSAKTKELLTGTVASLSEAELDDFLEQYQYQ